MKGFLRVAARKFVWSSRGSDGMLPRKIFKIKSPRLTKNAFPEISAWKNQIKISQQMALLLHLGVLETLSAGFGGGGQLPSYGPEKVRDFLFWKQ